MPDLVLSGLSDQLLQDLKDAESRNSRSLNSEVIARFTASVHGEPVDTERGFSIGYACGAKLSALWTSARRLYERCGTLDDCDHR